MRSIETNGRRVAALALATLLGLGCSEGPGTRNSDSGVSDAVVPDRGAEDVASPVDSGAADGISAADGASAADVAPVADAAGEGGGPPACGAAPATYDPALFDQVLEGFAQTDTLRLEGAQWNNTLVRNCKIHDTSGDGIFLKNVKNVVVTGCELWNIGGQAAIRASATGGTEDVILDGNTIHDTAQNGISAAQRSADGVNQHNLQILNNTISETGGTVSSGLTHGLYIQAQDFLIEGNTISGQRDGNAISVRSSGTVRCNKVSGPSKNGKPAVRYFSDHQAGPSNTLVIEANELDSATIGIDLHAPVDRYDGQSGDAHVVKSFIVKDNTVSAAQPLEIASVFQSSPYSLVVQGNTLINK